MIASTKDRRFKLVRTYHQPDGRGCDRMQLFDLAADPWGLHDRSADPDLAVELERLANAPASWQSDLRD